MTDTVWTGDDAADYLINRKAAEAQAAGIRYQANVEFPGTPTCKAQTSAPSWGTCWTMPWKPPDRCPSRTSGSSS